MATKIVANILICFAPVAQLDRASGYGPEGHGFESSSARQNKVHSLEWTLFFVCLKKRIRKGRFAIRQIATFRGTVAKSVGVSVALPPSESVHAK